ncbi:hypothetical protein WDY80_24165 (plasmid) [Gordonia hongkongensis]|uniref:hypothetical protein n=1 Tax=Gordonia hongkongensis TaxID=1701090 RepID=UPI0030CE27F7
MSIAAHPHTPPPFARTIALLGRHRQTVTAVLLVVLAWAVPLYLMMRGFGFTQVGAGHRTQPNPPNLEAAVSWTLFAVVTGGIAAAALVTFTAGWAVICRTVVTLRTAATILVPEMVWVLSALVAVTVLINGLVMA